MVKFTVFSICFLAAISLSHSLALSESGFCRIPDQYSYKYCEKNATPTDPSTCQLGCVCDGGEVTVSTLNCTFEFRNVSSVSMVSGIAYADFSVHNLKDSIVGNAVITNLGPDANASFTLLSKKNIPKAGYQITQKVDITPKTSMVSDVKFNGNHSAEFTLGVIPCDLEWSAGSNSPGSFISSVAPKGVNSSVLFYPGPLNYFVFAKNSTSEWLLGNISANADFIANFDLQCGYVDFYAQGFVQLPGQNATVCARSSSRSVAWYSEPKSVNIAVGSSVLNVTEDKLFLVVNVTKPEKSGGCDNGTVELVLVTQSGAPELWNKEITFPAKVKEGEFHSFVWTISNVTMLAPSTKMMLIAKTTTIGTVSTSVDFTLDGQSSSDSKLTKLEIVGVAVGGGIVLLIAIIVIVRCSRRRRDTYERINY